jgi:hypothetical protein
MYQEERRRLKMVGEKAGKGLEKNGQVTTLIKKKIKFSSYVRKFTVEQLQSHICMRKCGNISPYMGRPLVIYDFATAPF